MKIEINNLSDAIMREITEWCEDEETVIDEEIDKISEELVNNLKNNPIIPERTKKYKKSFYCKKVAKGVGYKRNVVANKKYQLTHLLEHPHLTRNGTSRTKGYPHWKTAQRKLEELMEGMTKKL